jgi:hypothetical protein
VAALLSIPCAAALQVIVREIPRAAEPQLTRKISEAEPDAVYLGALA